MSMRYMFTDRRGKTYLWSRATLEDTLFESEKWDTPAVRRRVAALGPEQTITIAGERLRATGDARNGLRSIGRSIARGAAGVVSRAKKAMQDERDDAQVAKVREHALGAGAQINANNEGHARHELEMARRALEKIHDADKRDRAERQYLAKMERMLRIRNRGHHGAGQNAPSSVTRNRSKLAARRLASAGSKAWG